MTVIESGLHLHIDCVSGAAGDMTIAAVLDLGVPREVVDAAVAAMGLEPSRLLAEKVVKGGISATDVRVDVEPSKGEHHDHHSYRDIERRIAGAELEPTTAALAQDIFARIARAEAKLHHKSLDEVHFHEVGAIDSIVDVVGAAAALAHLAPGSVSCPSVAMGHGSVKCAHGQLPVPSPAAVEIMREAGGVVAGGGIGKELCTPTGAAILAAVVTDWTECPPLTPVAIGYGAGDRDLEDRPNVMRVMVGRRPGAASDTVIQVEANIDDMTPEQASYLGERLFDVGALDVWWTQVVMKKSRPGFQLGVLSPPAALDTIVHTILTDSTTLGVRYQAMARRTLERDKQVVTTEFGSIEVVVARLDGRELRAVPEFESCRQAASRHGVAIAAVYAAAGRAYTLTNT
ncbi:MAG: nickel pincer cofactor biosynthesis protein LarC [Deltaproteobacteria bacterium]|nr:nickel pincer cofactor biosynthesis protein LarC [Deltaproteobacteria bacterium]